MGHINGPEREETSAECRSDISNTDIPGARSLWTQVLEEAKTHTSSEAVANWLKPLRVIAELNGAILVSAQDQYTLDRAEQEYERLLQTLWNDADPKQRRLKFQLWSRIDRAVREMVGDPWTEPDVAAVEAQQVDIGTPAARDDCMRFDTLVVGESNKRAVTLAKRIASGGAIQAGVVVIYGQPGTGKTHILKSILAETLRRGDKRRITYISAEEFMTRFVAGARAGDTEDLQAFVKQNELLMIDDLHWIAGKEKTDTAFFGALRKVTSEGGRVIITADAAPGDMVGLSKELTSEIRGAAAVEVGQPDNEMRKAIVRRHADLIAQTNKDFELTDSMVDRIVCGVHGPGRELCGVLWSLELETGFGEFAPTDEMLDTVIRRIAGEPRIPSLDDIKRACMDLFGVSKSDIESASKVRTICHPRQIGMYLSRVMTEKSYPQIAHAYKKKDHTTVLHAYRKITREMKKGDVDMIADIERARQCVFERLSMQARDA
ncbi:MAG: DnaA/Hda family protein [Pseudomonadota bacterium]